MPTTSWVHCAMWFEVVMSWNGRQNAAKLGSWPLPSDVGSTPTIQISVPDALSLLLLAGGGRRPYWRIEDTVSHSSACPSASWKVNGAHLGNELVRAVLPLSATPGPFAAASATGLVASGGSAVAHIVAVGSLSALQAVS